MKDIMIIASIDAKKEFREEVVHAFSKLAPASKAEAGNRQYDLLEDIENPGKFVVVEC